MKLKKICEYCKEEFEPKMANRPSRFCHYVCRSREYMERKKNIGNPAVKKCKDCGELCWGTQCRECYLKKYGMPVSRMRKPLVLSSSSQK